MKPPRAHRTGRRAAGPAGLLLALTAAGCAPESLRIALETQRRADEVQLAVFDRQHEALCRLLYRDLVRRLEAGGPALSDLQRAALEEAWNDRDLVEVWAIQQERAAALRLLGVDARLAADQPAVDLLLKQLAARTDRARHALAAQAGTEAAAPAGP